MAIYAPSTAKQSRVQSYRFTITDLNDYSLKSLQENIKLTNAELRKSRKRALELFGITKPKTSFRVRIRPRGPRFGDYHDSKKSTATHFDVYVHEVKTFENL